MYLIDPVAMVFSVAQISAAIALLNGVLTAIGQGNVVVSAITAIARQPESKNSVTSTMFIGLAMSETSGVYGLAVALIMLFANPLVAAYMATL